MVLVVRDVRDPWPGHVQRDTTSDGMLAFGHSRSGLTFIAPVAQQAEQPPCKRQAARSIRRRGHQTCRVRLDGRGHHPFKVDTRVRIPHAIPVQEPSSSSRFEGGNRPQRLGGAGTRDRMDFIGCVAQLGEQPPCKRQVAGSNPATSTMFASLTQRPECRPV
jgi:hypothetical protein